MSKPSVAVIGTGGTISSVGRDSLDLVAYLENNKVYEASMSVKVPGLFHEGTFIYWTLPGSYLLLRTGIPHGCHILRFPGSARKHPNVRLMLGSLQPI